MWLHVAENLCILERARQKEKYPHGKNAIELMERALGMNVLELIATNVILRLRIVKTMIH